jgi:electron transfer flavoprotein beta subunit
MRIAVCLKQVPDPATVEVDPLTAALDARRMLYIAGPADTAALEVALRLAGAEGHVSALSVGPPAADAVLRLALAAGATEAQRLWASFLPLQAPAQTALLLAAWLQRGEAPDLVLCGARSSDQGSGQVPALLAEFLDWPVVCDVTQITVEDDLARVQRRLDRGAREELEVRLPAVLAVETGIARLRHASLTGLMRAERAAIPVSELDDLGLEPADLAFPAATARMVTPPRPRTRPIFTPDSARPAHERITQIITAGVTRKSGKVLEGPPEQMADALVEFLRERGFV